MKYWVKQHPVVAYFVLTYAITWLIASPLIFSAQGFLKLPIPFAMHYLTAYGPFAAAIIVTGITTGTSGLRELLGRMLRWRVGLVWVLISAFSPVALFALAVVVVYITGGGLLDVQLLGAVNYLPNLGFGAWILWILNSGIGEETGWRGFALPRLQRNRSALSATLILAVGWIIWHLPFFLYLPNYVMLRDAVFPLFAIGIIAGAIILTWLYNSTGGSTLMVTLWHGALNFVTASEAGTGIVAAIVSTLIIIWGVAVAISFKPANLSTKGKHVV